MHCGWKQKVTCCLAQSFSSLSSSPACLPESSSPSLISLSVELSRRPYFTALLSVTSRFIFPSFFIAQIQRGTKECWSHCIVLPIVCDPLFEHRLIQCIHCFTLPFLPLILSKACIHFHFPLQVISRCYFHIFIHCVSISVFPFADPGMTTYSSHISRESPNNEFLLTTGSRVDMTGMSADATPRYSSRFSIYLYFVNCKIAPRTMSP